jgi:hypothetical protein
LTETARAMTSPNPSQFDTETPPVEVEINPELPGAETVPSALRVQLQQFQLWFEKLPAPVKVIVAVVLISVSLSLLTKVLHLVASLISVAISATFLYLLYRFILKPALSKDI